MASEVSLTLAGLGKSLEMACRIGVKNRFGGRGQAGMSPVVILWLFWCLVERVAS